MRVPVCAFMTLPLQTGDATPALSVQPSLSPLEHIRLLFGVDSRLLFPLQHNNKRMRPAHGAL
jgi:hypothetical protein